MEYFYNLLIHQVQVAPYDDNAELTSIFALGTRRLSVYESNSPVNLRDNIAVPTTNCNRNEIGTADYGVYQRITY